jgi:FSR family fosmidomycin resistance protein-like MFS transporter
MLMLPMKTAGIRRENNAGARTLRICCAVYALHDGLTDMLSILLPLWQSEFGLSFTAVGLLRAIYTGAMAAFQVPAGFLADRTQGRISRTLLALGAALAAGGFLLAGATRGLWLLVAALLLSGIGSSVQHPIGSSLIAQFLGEKRSRAALGTYNFRLRACSRVHRWRRG